MQGFGLQDLRMLLVDLLTTRGCRVDFHSGWAVGTGLCAVRSGVLRSHMPHQTGDKQKALPTLHSRRILCRLTAAPHGEPRLSGPVPEISKLGSSSLDSLRAHDVTTETKPHVVRWTCLFKHGVSLQQGE